MMHHHQHRHHHDHATFIKNGIDRIFMYRDGPDMGACVCASALGVCMRRMRLSMCCVLCFLSCLLREAGCVLCIICFALKLQEEKTFGPGMGKIATTMMRLVGQNFIWSVVLMAQTAAFVSDWR